MPGMMDIYSDEIPFIGLQFRARAFVVAVRVWRPAGQIHEGGDMLNSAWGGVSAPHRDAALAGRDVPACGMVGDEGQPQTQAAWLSRDAMFGQAVTAPRRSRGAGVLTWK